MTDVTDAGIMFGCPERLPPNFGILQHGAKLDDIKLLSIEADTVLAEESRTLAVQLHDYCCKQDDGRGKRQQQDTRDDVEQTLGEAREPPPGRKSIRKNEPAWIDAIKVEAPCLPLQKTGEIVDMHARGLDTKKIGKWKRVTTLLQGQHNLTCAEADQIGRASCRERACQYV